MVKKGIISILLTFFLLVSCSSNGNVSPNYPENLEDIIRPQIVEFLNNSLKGMLRSRAKSIQLTEVTTFDTEDSKKYAFYKFGIYGQNDKESSDKNVYYGFSRIERIGNQYFLRGGVTGNDTDSNLKNKLISCSAAGGIIYGLVLNPNINKLEFYIDGLQISSFNVSDKDYYFVDLNDLGNKTVEIKIYNEDGRLIGTSSI